MNVSVTTAVATRNETAARYVRGSLKRAFSITASLAALRFIVTPFHAGHEAALSLCFTCMHVCMSVRTYARMACMHVEALHHKVDESIEADAQYCVQLGRCT